jgi:hypothetical protein
MKQNNNLWAYIGTAILIYVAYMLIKSNVERQTIQCPTGFTPSDDFLRFPRMYDTNNNGWICTKLVATPAAFSNEGRFSVQDDIITSSKVKNAFEDNFSSANCRWLEFSDSSVESGCVQDRYRFKVISAGFIYPVLPTNPESYTNFLLLSKVEQPEGTSDSFYGVVFRYVDNKNYYLCNYSGIKPVEH